MNAIRTTYLDPKLRRKRPLIKALTWGDSQITVHGDLPGNSIANHKKAAQALCDKIGWKGEMIGDYLSAYEMAWVFLPKKTLAPVERPG